MSSAEFQMLSDKLDRLSEKIGEQFTRIEDVKLSKAEYERAHEALELRVQSIETKMENWATAGRAELNRLETANGVKYDKLEYKMVALDTKIDALKDNMILRFENQSVQQAANRRSWVQWGIPLAVTFFSGGGLGGIIIWYLSHLAHP